LNPINPWATGPLNSIPVGIYSGQSRWVIIWHKIIHCHLKLAMGYQRILPQFEQHLNDGIEKPLVSRLWLDCPIEFAPFWNGHTKNIQ
jgi:hypothetical protein